MVTYNKPPRIGNKDEGGVLTRLLLGNFQAKIVTYILFLLGLSLYMHTLKVKSNFINCFSKPLTHFPPACVA